MSYEEFNRIASLPLEDPKLAKSKRARRGTRSPALRWLAEADKINRQINRR